MKRRPWVDALVLLAVVFVFGASFVLLSRFIGTSSPWLALLLMFDFLGAARVAEPLFHLRMPAALRPVRRWELEGDVYRRLRVPGFGRFLRRSPLRHLNSGVYFDPGRPDLLQVRRQAESSEANHFWAAILFTPFIALVAFKGMWGVVAWFSLAQVVVNVYPILHLRLIRGRLERVMARTAAARAGSRRPMGSKEGRS